jgi:hypothetical protein
MTVVELLARLADEGVALVRWDVAGPVWTERPPAGAMPHIVKLWPELKVAWQAASTGHAWGQCDRCGRCAVTQWKGAGVACWMTPHCQGLMTTWARCPEAVEWWASVKRQVLSDEPIYVERRAQAAQAKAEANARAKDRRTARKMAEATIASLYGWLYGDSTDQPHKET